MSVESGFHFQNGLRWIVHSDNALLSTTIRIQIPVGFSFESLNKNLKGLTHLTEHMMFHSTLYYSNYFKNVDCIFYSFGETFKGETSDEWTTYFVTLNLDSVTQIKTILDLMINQLFYSCLNDEDLLKEKRIVAIEYSEHNSDPFEILYGQYVRPTVFTKNWNFLSWDGHQPQKLLNLPYFSTDMIRALLDIFYQPEFITCTIVTHFPINETKNILLDVWSRIKNEPHYNSNNIWYPIFLNYRVKWFDSKLVAIAKFPSILSNDPINLYQPWLNHQIKFVIKHSPHTRQDSIYLSLAILIPFMYQDLYYWINCIDILSDILAGAPLSSIPYLLRESYGCIYKVRANLEFFTNASLLSFFTVFSSSSQPLLFDLLADVFKLLEQPISDSDILLHVEHAQREDSLKILTSDDITQDYAEFSKMNWSQNQKQISLDQIKCTPNLVRLLASLLLQPQNISVCYLAPLNPVASLQPPSDYPNYLRGFNILPNYDS